MSSVNKQAEKAGATADAIHEALYGDNTPSGPEDVVETVETAQDADVVEIVKEDDTLVEPSGIDYETKFKVLQGKYNAEVPKLSRENRENIDIINALRVQLADAQQSAPTETVVDAASIDPEAFADYGDEFQQLASMVTTLQTNVQALETENTSLRESVNSVETTSADVAEANFYAEIDREMPEWRTVNGNPDFVSWLQEIDSISGYTRQAHLDSAAETLNATNAISIFKAFNGSTTQPEVTQDQNIARQTQPASSASPAPISKEKPVYTRAEIKQFYKDVTAGKWEAYEDEKKAIEADLFLAPSEGRVIG